MRLQATRVLSLLMALIGVVLIIEAFVVGGVAGFVVGLLFLLAGLGRVYVTTRRGGA